MYNTQQSNIILFLMFSTAGNPTAVADFHHSPCLYLRTIVLYPPPPVPWYKTTHRDSTHWGVHGYGFYGSSSNRVSVFHALHSLERGGAVARAIIPSDEQNKKDILHFVFSHGYKARGIQLL
jgi:hypothetical protein